MKSNGNGVGYADITALAEQFAATPRDVEAIAKRLVTQTTASIESYALAYAPRRTGTLANSITSRVENNGLTGVVEATAKYAIFVELGTGTRGEFPGQPIVIRPKNAKALRWVGPDGKVRFAKVVRSPGMKAQPFLRPALAQAIDELEASLGVAVVKEILGGPNA